MDMNTGDAVHVDFNCLFEKVASFALPQDWVFTLI